MKESSNLLLKIWRNSGYIMDIHWAICIKTIVAFNEDKSNLILSWPRERQSNLKMHLNCTQRNGLKGHSIMKS